MGPILSAVLLLSAHAWAADPDNDHDGAAFIVALDGDVVIPIMAGEPDVNFGGAVRVGWRAKVGPLFAQPELAFSLQALPSGAEPTSELRAMAGGRIGMRGMLQPQALAHLGYGGSPDRGGLVYDAGIGLDLHFGRVCAGLHVTFNGAVDAQAPATWVDVGPNLTILI